VRRKPNATRDRLPRKSLSNMREAASRFRNAVSEPPTRCPHMECQSRKLAVDFVHVRKRFPCKVAYLYCVACLEPVYRFPPKILIAPQTDAWIPAPPPRPSQQE